jgi:nondiscriminating glutamyl-tRNA synthetase
MVRVRFAPSPTGFLHVGNIRTALFNWLVARHLAGCFVLRIEDTDAERSKTEYEDRLMEDLRWLGLEWDEGVDRGGAFGPYRQSDRYSIYRSYAQQLLEQDKAFYCFCSEDELEEIRQQQISAGETSRYSGKCRQLSAGEIIERRSTGASPSIRLRVRPGNIGFTDLVYGRIDIDSAQISDPVIVRSDGSPTYNFSCVIDDVLMKISHVIRGEGHLSNTHRQMLIYEALGVPPPQFAHLSTVLGPDGQKLSKRHGATSVEEFRQQGYLPEALANYLALLGWSPSDEVEVLSAAALIKQFDLTRVSKSPAIFDCAKLDWMNRTYINKSEPQELASRAEKYFIAAGLVPANPSVETRAWLMKVVDMLKTRVDHLDQLPGESAIVFGFESDPPALDAEAQETLASPAARAVALEFYRSVKARDVLTLDAYKEILGRVKTATKQQGKNLFHPIRAALTGRGSGPEMDRLIPIYEEGSQLSLPRHVMSCRERLEKTVGSKQ